MLASALSLAIFNTAPAGGAPPVASGTLPMTIAFGGAAFDGENTIYYVGGYGGSGFSNAIIAVDVNDYTSSIVTYIPVAVKGPSVLWLDGALYIFGGDDGASMTNAIYVYDPVGESVDFVGNMPETLGYMGAVSVGGKGYFFGGYSGTYSGLSNKIWEFDTYYLEFMTSGLPTMPSALNKPAVAYTGTYVYIFGGEDEFGTEMEGVYRFDPAEGTCVTVVTEGSGASMPVIMTFPTSEAGAVSVNGTVFVYGGKFSSSSVPNIVEFDPRAEAFIHSSDLLAIAVRGLSAVAVDDEVILMGGYSDQQGQYFNTISAHKPRQTHRHSSCYPVSSNPTTMGFADVALASTGTYVYACGGVDEVGSIQNTIVRIDATTKKSTVVGVSLPAAVRSACAAWHDGQVSVFGGIASGDPDHVTDYIQIYEPSSGASAVIGYLAYAVYGAEVFVDDDYAYVVGGRLSGGATCPYIQRVDLNGWSCSVVADLNVAVYDFVLGWDGGKFAYIAGGQSGGSATDVVQSFDTDTLAVANIGALPYPVCKATGAYFADTGLLTIMGGEGPTYPYNYSAIIQLDPATTEWGLAATKLPAPLIRSSFVVDGGILYGGQKPGEIVDWILVYRDGPEAFDGYSEMAEARGPSVRMADSATALHSNSMYVFGGQDGMTEFDGIWKVSPADGLFNQVATLPQGMSRASAVTIGQYIYVFGGYSNFFTYPLNYLTSIYRFDTADNTLVARGSLPQGIFYSSACTDGTYAYIIGGCNTGGLANSLYVYDPSDGSIDSYTLPYAVYSSASGYHNGYVYYAGGRIGGGNVDTVCRFPTSTMAVAGYGELQRSVWGSICAMYGSRLIVAGGEGNGTYIDRIQVFDVVSKASYYSDITLGHTFNNAVGVGGFGYVYSGQTPMGMFPGASRCQWEPDDHTFDRLTTSSGVLPSNIYDSGAAYDGERYTYLINGINAGSIDDLVWRYDKQTGTAVDMGVGIGTPLFGSGVVYDPLNARVYMMGGGDGASSYNYISYFDVGTGNIYASGDSLVIGVSGIEAQWMGDRIIYAGGFSGAFESGVYTYNPTTHSVTYLAALPYGLTGYGSFMHDSKFYLVGGQTPGMYSPGILRFDPDTRVTETMNARLPYGVVNPAVTYDAGQNLAYIFGGLDGLGVARSGIFIYDPDEDILTQADSVLPTGLFGASAVFDSALVIGGSNGGTGLNQVLSFDYVHNAPSGSDYIDDDAPGDITLDTNYPHAYSYDLKQTSTGVSALNWQIQPGLEYYFELEVGHALGYQYLDYVSIQAWFDQGSELSFYNETEGGTANFEFFYENSTATGDVADYGMNWPAYGELTSFTCTETNLPPGDPYRSQRKVLRFHFTPSYFMRWADGVAGGLNPPDLGDSWQELTAFNDADSWNFEINVADNVGNANTTYDEFGVYKYQQLAVQHGDPYLAAPPGTPQTQMTTTDALDRTIVYTRMNAPFRLSANITDLNGPDTIAATYMYMDGGSLPGVTQFTGPGFANRIYYKGLAGNYVIHQNTTFGSWYESALTWFIEVPAGIAEGRYDGYITYRSETAIDPSQAALPANAPPVSPLVHSPSSGAVVTGVSAMLSVSVADPSRVEGGATIASSGGEQPQGAVTVMFIDALMEREIGRTTVASGGVATQEWTGITDGEKAWYVILDDGEYATVSPAWGFTFNYNQEPYPAYGSVPADSGSATGPSVTLQFTLSDPDGDEMWATLYDGSNNPLQGYGPVSSGATLSYEYTPPGGWNSWYVVVSDGVCVVGGPTWTYYYTYANDNPDTPAYPTPANPSSVMGPLIQLQCYASDPDGQDLTVDFYGDSGAGYNFIGSDSVPSGSYASTTWNCPSLGSYTWYAMVSDGSLETGGPAWSFTVTTMNNYPSVPSEETPTAGGTTMGLSVPLQCYVYDADGDYMTVQFWEQGGGLISQLSGVASGTYPSIVWDTTYYGWHYWYVVLIDEHGLQTVGNEWYFQNM